MEELGHISERSKGFSYNIDYSTVLVPKDKKLLQQIHPHSSLLCKLQESVWPRDYVPRMNNVLGSNCWGPSISMINVLMYGQKEFEKTKNIRSVGASGDGGIEPLHELEERAKTENY